MANNAPRLHKQVREGGNKTHRNISIIYWTSRDCYSNHIANLGQEEADKEGSLRQEFPGQPHCKCWKGNRADEAVPRGLLTSAFNTRVHPTCQSLHCKIFGKISRWCFCAVLNTEETKQNPTQRLLPGKRAGMHVRTHIMVRGVLHPCVSFNQGVLPHHFSQVYGRCLWKEINAWHGPEIFGLCMCVWKRWLWMRVGPAFWKGADGRQTWLLLNASTCQSNVWMIHRFAERFKIAYRNKIKRTAVNFGKMQRPSFFSHVHHSAEVEHPLPHLCLPRPRRAKRKQTLKATRIKSLQWREKNAMKFIIYLGI